MEAVPEELSVLGGEHCHSGVMTDGPKLTRVRFSPGNFFTRGGFEMSCFMMSGIHLRRTALNLEFELSFDGCLLLLDEFTAAVVLQDTKDTKMSLDPLETQPRFSNKCSLSFRIC